MGYPSEDERYFLEELLRKVKKRFTEFFVIV